MKEAAPQNAPVYKMKDLCELTGLSRQAIHFYIGQGLLPEGKKTGRNMAFYGPEHVERLQLIRRLQEERFLPLKTIRAVLAGEIADLPAPKRAVLTEVAARLAPPAQPLVDVDEALARTGVPRADFDRMVELGQIAVVDDGDRAQVASEALWLLDLWGQFRGLGFTADLGFTPDDLQMFDEAMAALFRRETSLLVDRLADQPPARVAPMIERVLPLINALLIHLHTTNVRNFFAAHQR